MALAEAMAHGVAPIATATGLAARWTPGAEAGVAIPAGDADALRRAVLAVLRDDSRRHALAVAALREAEQWSAQHVALTYLSLYENLVAGTGLAGAASEP
jgi:glycosyltransferase involved in cell wall biosynthesis